MSVFCPKRIDVSPIACEDDPGGGLLPSSIIDGRKYGWLGLPTPGAETLKD